MPVYVYLCDECGEETEEFFFKYSDRPPSVTCPNCFAVAFVVPPKVHVAGKHTNKDSERVPGKNLSMTVDGFRVERTPEHVRKKIKRGARRLTKMREPGKLKTVKEN